ncbi:MAG TPA: hypothetical protein VMB04_00070 [Mycobacterium sp.]|nr:hypothetical protein [Mycobacterium sp.]
MDGSLPRYPMLAVPLAAVSIVVGCGHSNVTSPQSPSTSPVSVELKTSQPTYPAGTPPQISMMLRNNGSHSCALPSVADGSIEVVSVTRDGTAVVGRPGRESLFNGMAAVVALGLRSVDAGQSISVPLDVEVSAHGSPVLSTSQQTAVDEGSITTWLLDQPGKYRVTARLVAVTGVQRSDLPQQCAITGTPASAEFQVTT